MKKIVAFFVVLLLVVPLLFLGAFLYTGYATTEETVPKPSVSVNGVQAFAAGYEWEQPYFYGFGSKAFIKSPGNAKADFGEADTAGVALNVPAGYDTVITLTNSDTGAEIFKGALGVWNGLALENGRYDIEIRSTKIKAGKTEGYGTFAFFGSFTVNVPQPEPEPEPEPEKPTVPTIAHGKTSLQQGDVFPVTLLAIPEGVKPKAETDLGMAIFASKGEGEWQLVVPVSNVRKTGNYSVKITAGELKWDLTVTVTEFPFEEQNLIIDLSKPETSEAASDKAYQEYREKIPPLFKTYDEEIYWEGEFIQPVEGRISTPFGVKRYTNGANPRSHWGLDIAAPEGTEISAPNNGRVVLAEKLLNTGNTIVIEHGGGLKSYYYHLFELKVNVGDMVQKGDIIGLVGTTGYSTGPHLHFETRIGAEAISPTMLFSNDSGLYSIGAQENETVETG